MLCVRYRCRLAFFSVTPRCSYLHVSLLFWRLDIRNTVCNDVEFITVISFFKHALPLLEFLCLRHLQHLQRIIYCNFAEYAAVDHDLQQLDCVRMGRGANVKAEGSVEPAPPVSQPRVGRDGAFTAVHDMQPPLHILWQCCELTQRGVDGRHATLVYKYGVVPAESEEEVPSLSRHHPPPHHISYLFAIVTCIASVVHALTSKKTLEAQRGNGVKAVMKGEGGAVQADAARKCDRTEYEQPAQ
mmetsp:Transcript_42836/g.110457  ORF Transcript_42836/g.110457 Transcript_42836/m.110457 type:complete len:243 (-) Transcript_42836:1797-2525(-)